jgi:hypothetical protein
VKIVVAETVVENVIVGIAAVAIVVFVAVVVMLETVH